ncbi:hypothetical protein [Streptomyces sp. NPDC087300]|uniref:hypothetical protein n=1 Tax=Streptomyces sp. NPDC087300 TaxID=3365780 RepID=UPI00381E89E8
MTSHAERDVAEQACADGESALARHEGAEAGKHFQEALALVGGDVSEAAARLAARAHTGVGRARLAAGELDAAVAEFDLARALRPSAAGPLHWLGCAAAHRGDLAAAETHLTAALACAVPHPRSLIQRAYVHAAAGRPAAARTDLLTASRAAPLDEEASWTLAALSGHPPREVALRLRAAAIASATGDDDRAGALLEAAWGLDPYPDRFAPLYAALLVRSGSNAQGGPIQPGGVGEGACEGSENGRSVEAARSGWPDRQEADGPGGADGADAGATRAAPTQRGGPAGQGGSSGGNGRGAGVPQGEQGARAEEYGQGARAPRVGEDGRTAEATQAVSAHQSARSEAAARAVLPQRDAQSGSAQQGVGNERSPEGGGSTRTDRDGPHGQATQTVPTGQSGRRGPDAEATSQGRLGSSAADAQAARDRQHGQLGSNAADAQSTPPQRHGQLTSNTADTQPVPPQQHDHLGSSTANAQTTPTPQHDQLGPNPVTKQNPPLQPSAATPHTAPDQQPAPGAEGARAVVPLQPSAADTATPAPPGANGRRRRVALELLKEAARQAPGDYRVTHALALVLLNSASDEARSHWEPCVAAWAALLYDDGFWEHVRATAARRYGVPVEHSLIPVLRAGLREFLERRMPDDDTGARVAPGPLLQREADAAKLLAGVGGLPSAEGGSGGEPLFCGPLRIAALGRTADFGAFAARLEARAFQESVAAATGAPTAGPPAAYTSLTYAFSELGFAQLLLGQGKPVDALAALTELRCPGCRTRGGPGAGAVCEPDCARFDELNPGYAGLPDRHRRLALDARGLALEARLSMGRAELTAVRPDFEAVTAYWRRALVHSRELERYRETQTAIVDMALGAARDAHQVGRLSLAVDTLEATRSVIGANERGRLEGQLARVLADRGISVANDEDALLDEPAADLRRSVAFNPHLLRAQVSLGIVLRGLALARWSSGSLSGARDTLREAIDQLTAALGYFPDDPDLEEQRGAAVADLDHVMWQPDESGR